MNKSKVISVALALMVGISFTGCGSTKSGTNTSKTNPSVGDQKVLQILVKIQVFRMEVPKIIVLEVLWIMYKVKQIF